MRRHSRKDKKGIVDHVGNSSPINKGRGRPCKLLREIKASFQTAFLQTTVVKFNNCNLEFLRDVG
jgi:hypothetical protein